MFIGLLRVEVHLPATNSLKEKRSIIKPLLSRLRRDYNLAVAELDHADVWRSCVIGAVTICGSRQVAEKTLNRALGVIEHTNGCELIEQQIEFL